ncbi:Coenzyme F420 hydrogenase/dehydrogenase, beta subunit C-terminal domain [Chitinophagaceae bacterium LB-8]|uniref:Coenzyme F420 hydrogenase/dehydrogenase, beta subunit C-terminal domain n=1 Tax=Paraflavisolibacter caeni TaxID=2982496 RepID=A0A9X3B6M8_9BACT|nr:Coenzyme F420 hydrogenase/dehydrogenase, beta subunit C-terminal domain [Paraflavisolibacter caeni]MCU7548270.1 Coenzyme F420 hydrogenase/dehydrogenase, beta subunit C-terminal domain [Paraflavisolibacter caeni]
MSNSVISEIDRSGLCLGCGLCEAVLGKENCTMQLRDDGFFHPQFKRLDKKSERVINEICPSINVRNEYELKKDERIWGKIIQLYEGFSADQEVRAKSSSGGVVSALAIYLLEHKKVDAVLHVGGDADDYQQNKLRKSYDREDVIRNNSSRYAPALMFSDIFEILNQSDEIFCFIGKPCDIAALKNFLRVYPTYQDRFKLTISIVCAGMPSFNGTRKLISDFHPQVPIKNLSYRGNGWPGYFSFSDNSGKVYSKSYNDSWGKVLNRHLCFRCKICPEGIGLLADIAIGDAWETKNGYPDFTEKEGNSLVITRTAIGQQVVDELINDEAIFCKSLPVEKLRLMQPFQYRRRKYAGMRIIAAMIAKQFLFRFHNLYIYRNLEFKSPKRLMKEFLGTFKRAIKMA